MKEQNKPTVLRVTRPTLLMLSHCVPVDGSTDGDRARAWQLLETYSRSHEVKLACLADGAVSLSQWRQLHGKTKQIVMEPVGQLRRWSSRAMSIASSALADALLMRQKLAQPVSEWSTTGGIETVLCTRLHLMDCALLAGDCERIVDHHAGADLTSHRAAQASTWIISDPAASHEIAALNKRTILMPVPQPVRAQPSIRLVTGEDEGPIAMPAPVLHKAA